MNRNPGNFKLHIKLVGFTSLPEFFSYDKFFNRKRRLQRLKHKSIPIKKKETTNTNGQQKRSLAFLLSRNPKNPGNNTKKKVFFKKKDFVNIKPIFNEKGTRNLSFSVSNRIFLIDSRSRTSRNCWLIPENKKNVCLLIL